jgi:hypothetical protein
LNTHRIFAPRSSTNSITSDIIPKRSKACFNPFFDFDVELFMRTYIAYRFPSAGERHVEVSRRRFAKAKEGQPETSAYVR